MTIMTNRGGFASAATQFDYASTTREQRALILEREARDKARRKAYRKKPKPRIGSAGDTFKEYSPHAPVRY